MAAECERFKQAMWNALAPTADRCSSSRRGYIPRGRRIYKYASIYSSSRSNLMIRVILCWNVQRCRASTHVVPTVVSSVFSFTICCLLDNPPKAVVGIKVLFV